MDIAPTNKLPDISWSYALELVQSLCIKEIVALEQKANWHEIQINGSNYSHTEAAKMCRYDAEQLRQALIVLARGV